MFLHFNSACVITFLFQVRLFFRKINVGLVRNLRSKVPHLFHNVIFIYKSEQLLNGNGKMSAFSPVFKQFLTIICCKFFLLNLKHFQLFFCMKVFHKLKINLWTGNLLVLSYGWTSGWATINLDKLGNETNTFIVGSLSDSERSLVISILFAGSFTGTCTVIPISQFIGIKRTIHLFGLSLVVSAWKIWKVNNIQWI